jgi:hypothetical protein
MIAPFGYVQSLWFVEARKGDWTSFLKARADRRRII